MGFEKEVEMSIRVAFLLLFDVSFDELWTINKGFEGFRNATEFEK